MSPLEALLRLVAAAIAGYCIGSIPSGVVVGRLFGNVDPRTRGSGKTGTTNILRTLGPGPAAMVLILDLAKGIAAVLLARYVFMPTSAGASADLRAWAEAIGALAAVLGHTFSVFIHFTGGRGVATGGGAIFAMQPIVGVAGLIAMAVPIAITRYVSLGSMLAAIACAALDLGLVLSGRDLWGHAAFMIIGAIFILWSHRDNIERLVHGTERKLGQPHEAHA
jgi:glycerol-3-phosphate acyltransferase PlsY